MTVRDLLKMEICVDVVDDVTEELYIAFDGPQKLTPAGEKKFALALDLEVEPSLDPNLWIIHVDSDDERTWKRRLRAASALFEGMAGYCSTSDYKLWFKEESDEGYIPPMDCGVFGSGFYNRVILQNMRKDV